MATIEQAKAAMIQAGISVDDIALGAAYAERIGYEDGEEFFARAVAAILYSATQLAQCEEAGRWYPVQAGSLDEVAPQHPKRPRGRPPAVPGTARDELISIRTTAERKAKAQRLAAAAGLSVSAWWDAQIDSAPER